MRPLEGKRILLTGGTGSLGRAIVRRILGDSAIMGDPSRITVFSRDETKQHEMRLTWMRDTPDTETVIFRNFRSKLQFVLGDVRNANSIASALSNSDIVIHAAAQKQVPTCEYFPGEAVQTNILGAVNIVESIERYQLPVETVIGISTDKACKPVNVMGMTKAIQERILIQANLRSPDTRYVCVRYGNVLASRGSVIPLFLEQVRKGGPVTVTSCEMTRFLLGLHAAVDIVFAAIQHALPGDILIPKVPSGRVVDMAKAVIGAQNIRIESTGVRPGEKTHEILVSEEELPRIRDRGSWYAVESVLPEIRTSSSGAPVLTKEYNSADHLIPVEKIQSLLEENGLLGGGCNIDAAAPSSRVSYARPSMEA